MYFNLLLFIHQPLNYTLNQFVNDNTFSQDGIFYRDLFMETWNASRDFWKKYKGLSKFSWSWENTVVVFADANI